MGSGWAPGGRWHHSCFCPHATAPDSEWAGADLAWGQGGLKPPTPRNSMESIGKKEGEEGERKEGGRRKGGLEEEEGR